jgi:lysophospholipase L1-like esterase
MRKGTHIGAVAVMVVAGLATEASAQTTSGAIGDSISAAMDADDNCNALNTCAGKIGEDWAYSWTTGTTLANSMRARWGATTSAVRAQRNGSRWDDAPGQADQIAAAGGTVGRTTIELGGNDVCRKYGETLPTKAEITAYMEQTFQKLSDGMQYGGEVVVASVPNVVGLYNTMRTQPNFAFSTCDDLWNLRTDNMHMNLVEGGFCNIPFLGSMVCGAINAIGQIVQTFVSPLMSALINVFDVQFPCGAVLDSRNTQANRDAAAQLNRDINDAIAEEVAAWNAKPLGSGAGYRRVTFRTDNRAVYNYSFTTQDVSHLDCFHPSRRGQEALADRIWNASYAQSQNSTTQNDSTVPGVSSGSWSEWWSSSSSGYKINVSYASSETSAVDVYLSEYGYGTWYLGTLNQQPTSHQFGVGYFSYSDYYYNWWAVDVRLKDRAGNASPMLYYPSWI